MKCSVLQHTGKSCVVLKDDAGLSCSVIFFLVFAMYVVLMCDRLLEKLREYVLAVTV